MPATVAEPKNSKTPEALAKKPKTSTRESVETIVFVVVLVLVLQLFVLEAFVIPTGSMAETQFGYHKIITCEQCDHNFPVNASCEIEPPPKERRAIIGYCCPNCRFVGKLNPTDGPSRTSGDRVLVHKVMPTNERGYVVVFKFPETPQINQVSQNYIKRLVGLPGETVGIHCGEVYLTDFLEYPESSLDEDTNQPLYPRPRTSQGDLVSEDLWQPEYTFHQADSAQKLFWKNRDKGFPDAESGFHIWRKPNDLVLEERRLVYDNDKQAKDLIEAGVPPRWLADQKQWELDSAKEPKRFKHNSEELNWVRYTHMVVKDRRDLISGYDPTKTKPSVISNYMGYNSGIEGQSSVDPFPKSRETTEYWVGDLLLECEVAVSDPKNQFVMELSRGQHRYQAVFADGTVQLIRTGPGEWQPISRPTPITTAGTFQLRFANIDSRLRVWVNGDTIDFGTEADYFPIPPSTFEPEDIMHEGWTKANDLAAPASFAAKGSVEVSQIKLWRDTYYTHWPANPALLSKYVDTYYVQPGHFLCLGDNSAQSHDSRGWGVVPERLMLGRAVFVFFPLNRIGFIR